MSIRCVLLVLTICLRPVPAWSRAAVASDFDRSGVVDFGDFLAFASGFGRSEADVGYEAKFDLNDGGSVDFSDFLIFAESFGQNAVDPLGEKDILFAAHNTNAADATLRLFVIRADGSELAPLESVERAIEPDIVRDPHGG